MLDLSHFVNENLFHQSNKVKKHEKLLANAVISFMKKQLKFDAKQIQIRKKQSDNTIGDISLSDNSINKSKFVIHFNPNQSYIMIIKTLIHELTHVKQVSKGELKPSSDWKSIIWKDKFELSVKDYKKAMKSFEEYKKLPWETEAYNNSDIYLDKFINSDYFKNLKGQDQTLDFIIDNI